MIRELKTLIAIAREGTFAAAGEKVGLTQAAVSAQMHRLEAELGQVLFDRTGRSVRLNHTGRQILLQAQELIRLYDNLGSVEHSTPGEVRVNMGAIASAQRTLLPTVLARFHHQCRGCHTRVVPGVSIELLNLVDAGEIDFAILIRPPFELQADLRWTTLSREPFRLIVPRDIAGDNWVDLLAGQPFVRYDRASFGGRQVDRFLREKHLYLREVVEVDELEAIVQMVARGVGVALVPQTAPRQRWPAGVRAIDLGPDTFYRDIGLVHRANWSVGEPVQQLVDLITNAYRASGHLAPA